MPRLNELRDKGEFELTYDKDDYIKRIILPLSRNHSDLFFLTHLLRSKWDQEERKNPVLTGRVFYYNGVWSVE
jgi:hypothetical protein